MTRLLEDYLTEEDRRVIAAVLESYTLRFDHLVRIAGLDPSEDFKHSDLRNLNFCGADLRGFDFTGSNLSGGITDERTQIDESTILDDAKLRWVSERDIPIVQLMQEVQSAHSGKQRMEALETLEKKCGKTDHVISFVVNAALEVATAEEFLDYAEFLPDNLQPRHLSKLINAGERALRKKFSTSRARTGREATTIFAASTIAERLEKAEGSFAANWFASLAELVDANQVNDALLGTTVKLERSDIINALKKLQPDTKETN